MNELDRRIQEKRAELKDALGARQRARTGTAEEQRECVSRFQAISEELQRLHAEKFGESPARWGGYSYPL